MLTAACYFDGGGDEGEIRDVGRCALSPCRLAVGAEWHRNGVTQGWKPECGFLHYGWEGYNEATILYVLGLGSPTHPLATTSFGSWTMTYQWENLLGQDVLYSGPLFTHLFSHAWIDFRGMRDDFMREKGSDYFENTKSAIALHREYGARNPDDYEGYGRNFWGITAGDGPERSGLARERPGPALLRLHVARRALWAGRRHHRALGDAGDVAVRQRRGADGNASSASALSASVHERSLFQRLQSDPARQPAGWLSEGWYGLDQGLLVMMIENHRSDLIWKLLRGCPYVRSGLKRAGFEGGWL